METEQLLYDQVQAMILASNFEDSKEKLLISLVSDLRSNNHEDFSAKVSNLSPDDLSITVEIISLMMSNARLQMENEIILSGSATEVQALGDMVTHQLEFLESLQRDLERDSNT